MIFLKRILRISSIGTTGVVLLMALASIGTGQVTSDLEREPAREEVIEQIADNGQKSVQTLRHDVDVAEERIFDVFNSFNKDATYDVHCEYKVTLGSRRREHDCKAAFQRDYEALLALRNNDSYSGVGERPLPSKRRLRKNQENFQKKIAKAVADHAELREAMAAFANARKDLESERQRR